MSFLGTALHLDQLHQALGVILKSLLALESEMEFLQRHTQWELKTFNSTIGALKGAHRESQATSDRECCVGTVGLS